MKKLWFKAKIYGWGWVPCSWEGWLVTLGFILLVYLDVHYFLQNKKFIEYVINILILIGLISFICYKTGEKPRWSWG